MNAGVVDEKSVLVFSMIAQRLAVVTEKNYQATIVKLMLFQPGKESTQFVIGISNLPVVGMIAILRSVRLWGIVWAMRVVQMQPEKKWPAWCLLHPADCVRNTVRCLAVHQADIFLLESFRLEGVIIKVEAPRQSPTARQHERADHSASCISMLFECLRDGAKLRRQRLSREILYAILKRIRAGQDSRVGRPGQRHLRECPFENHPFAAQGIQNRRLHLLCAVAPDMVSPKRVHGDEDDIGGGLPLACSRTFARGSILREAGDREKRESDVKKSLQEIPSRYAGCRALEFIVAELLAPCASLRGHPHSGLSLRTP